jgi:hypothetical protein
MADGKTPFIPFPAPAISTILFAPVRVLWLRLAALCLGGFAVLAPKAFGVIS